MNLPDGYSANANVIPRDAIASERPPFLALKAELPTVRTKVRSCWVERPARPLPKDHVEKVDAFANRRPVRVWLRHDTDTFRGGAVLAPDGYTMRGVIAVIVVLIGLVVFTPFAGASTYEAWTDGLYDAELQDDILALLSLHAVIDRVALSDARCIAIVVAVVVLADDRVGDLADPSTRSARAPPTP